MPILRVSPLSIVSATVCSLALGACGGTNATLGAMPGTGPAAGAANNAATDRSLVPAATARNVVLPPSTSTMAAADADAFVDSVGVDTHFNYGQSSYRTAYTAVRDSLVASGIRHIRDGGFGYSNPLALAYLAQHGVKHSAGFPIGVTADEITSTLQSYGSDVDFVEPQNEYDETAGSNPNWAAQLTAEQQLLYATVKSNASFANVTVLGPSFGHPWNAAAVGNLDAYEDAGNEHDYTCNYNPGTDAGAGVGPVTTLLRAATATKPMWTTEAGYADNATGWGCALSDAVIAKFDPRTIADRWLAGEPRTYFYQYADMAPGQNYNSMGLVTQTGQPKVQYTALQSMLSLLSDKGAPFVPTPLAVSVGGNTANVDQLLLQKRDGSYYLMLWLEVPGWNATTSTPIRNGTQRVTLSFAHAPSSVTQYGYAGNWRLGSARIQPASTVTVPVTDAITFVRLTF